MNRSTLEFEDILADRERQDDGGQDRVLETPIRRKSLRFFFLASAALFVLFVVRAGSLTILEGEKLARIAEESRERQEALLPPRGAIIDRNGVVLVENEASFALVFDPTAARSETPQNIAVTLRRVAETLGFSEEELRTRMDPYRNQAESRVIAVDVPREGAVRLAVSDPSAFLRVEPAFRRSYTKGAELYSAITGYVGPVTDAELDENPALHPRELVGKAGVEKSYDRKLRGSVGRRTAVIDARGRLRQEAVTAEAVPGQTLRLEVDSGIQAQVGDALARAMRASRAVGAAAVALDPRDGSVLALVSLPTYDPSALSRGVNDREYEKLASDARSPFLNRVTSGVYPSGSTVKPFIGAAALAERVVSPFRRIDDTAGFIRVTSIYDPNVSWTFPDWKPHGFVNFIEAIARSANVYFYEVGGGYGDIKGLGVDRINRYLRAFGFGEPLGVDLPAEASGRVPTPEWKKAALGEAWFIGDTYNLSIGQGSLGVTPLQLASATAAIANGGKLYAPRVADAIVGPGDVVLEEIPPKLLREVPVSSEDLTMVRRGMRAAVTEPYGTNRLLAGVAMRSAAKTGTAQYGNAGRTHAWVTAFAPYENPEIVLAILLEGGGQGTVATAVAKEVLDWYAVHRAQSSQ